jgi:hypothetical protein
VFPFEVHGRSIEHEYQTEIIVALADVDTGAWISKNGTESRLQQYTIPLAGGLGIHMRLETVGHVRVPRHLAIPLASC